MTDAPITQEQFAILDHTIRRGAAGQYCGGGPKMDELVNLGLMRFSGRAAWCPNSWYSITEIGRHVHALNKSKFKPS